MRKVETQMVSAIVTKQPVWSCGSTSVVTNGDVTEVRLHGNKIAEITDHWVRLNDCGWQTVTTKSRLNAILQGLFDGIGIVQEKFEWFVCEQGTTTPFGADFMLQR